MELQIHKITDGSMPSETIVSDPTEADVIKAIEEILDYTADATSENKKAGYATLASTHEVPMLKAISSQIILTLTGGYIDLGDGGAAFLQLEATQLYWTVYLRAEPNSPVLRVRRNSLSSTAVLKDCFVTYLNHPAALPELDWVTAPDLK